MSENIQILMATYNAGKWLTPQIESFFSQTYINWTLLCSDGGSSDGTFEDLLEWQRRYPEKIYLLPRIGRLGVTANFFRLIQNAKDDAILVFSDQDDVWVPEKLSTILQETHELDKKQPWLYYGDLYICEGKMEPQKRTFFQKRKLIASFPDTLPAVVTYPLFNGCTMAINPVMRSYATDIPVDLLEYWDFALAIAAYACGAVFVRGKKPLIYHRIHQTNYSFLNSISKNFFVRKLEVLQRLKKERIAFTEMLNAVAFFRKKNFLCMDVKKCSEFDIGLVADSTFFKRLLVLFPAWFKKLPFLVLLQRILLFFPVSR